MACIFVLRVNYVSDSRKIVCLNIMIAFFVFGIKWNFVH
jgi:hypothetical protein